MRVQKVDKETPPEVQKRHEESLTEGRDILKQSDGDEKQKWLSKDGEDWSGAFTHDPKAYMDSSGRKRAEPGADPPIHDPVDPSDDDDNISGDDLDDDSDDSADLGVHDAEKGGVANGSNGREARRKSITENQKDQDETNKRTEKRKNRGLRQWKPVRNIVFAKDEAKFAAKKISNKLTGDLSGREPDVETEV